MGGSRYRGVAAMVDVNREAVASPRDDLLQTEMLFQCARWVSCGIRELVPGATCTEQMIS